MPQTAAPTRGWPEIGVILGGRPRSTPASTSCPTFAIVRMPVTDNLVTVWNLEKPSRVQRDIRPENGVPARDRCQVESVGPRSWFWSCAAPSIGAPASCPPEIMLHAGVTAQPAELTVPEIGLSEDPPTDIGAGAAQRPEVPIIYDRVQRLRA